MSEKKPHTSGAGPEPSLDAACEILDKIWDWSETEQTRWLDQNCHDAGLRAEVESLLAADTKANEFLGKGAVDKAGAWLDASLGADIENEQRIGRYRIVRKIARGGMGEVFQARRDEGDFDQTVAIKLAHRFIDTAERRARFLEERQILARLEHPNIARLIDGGIWDGDQLADGGRPFLVMEYVDGKPINEYCTDHGLDLEERLNLFLTVCEAVQFAHQNLLIHRDIKPANILVSESGQVKLLDFGIATALSEESALAETQTPLMTPEFAAPEQVRGEPLTTATDVYALGLLLYELLSGTRAFDFQGTAHDEVIRQICQTMPTSPSVEAGSQSDIPWARSLRGDLDTIILKSLAKEPVRRYSSARALAVDIQNYLDGLPVRAQPDSRSYRIKKFLSRHRWESVTAGIAIFAVIGALVMALLSAAEARRALEQTRIEANKSAAVIEFLREMFAASDPRQTSGEKYGVREILEAGRARIDELADHPEVQGQLLSELGSIYLSLGENDIAFEILSHAREVQTETLSETHPAVSAVLHDLSLLEENRGNLEAAESLARQSLSIREAADPLDEAAVGEAMDRLGTAISGQGRYEEAEPWKRGAVNRLMQHAGERDKRTLTALHNLAWLQSRLGQNDAAVETYREVIRLGEVIHGPNDPDLLVTRGSLAVALRRQGSLEEAETISREVLARRMATTEEPHWELGYAYHNLARLLVEQGQPEEALPLYQSALSNWEPTLGPDHPNVGVTLLNMGKAFLATGDVESAERSWRRSIVVLEDEAGYEDRVEENNLLLSNLQTDRTHLPEQ
ncbi:MAG TPA: serine/threonine-protein kinase [Xanthomonadales bacterium]|nr:serine/threonine-protein kinase [Xanthomonadales bacterium]